MFVHTWEAPALTALSLLRSHPAQPRLNSRMQFADLSMSKTFKSALLASQPGASAPGVAESLDGDSPLKGTGLILVGEVRSRKRKPFPNKATGATRWVITITVMTASALYQVQRWSDHPLPSDLPNIGDRFNQEITARAIVTKAGPMVKFETASSSADEEF